MMRNNVDNVNNTVCFPNMVRRTISGGDKGDDSTRCSCSYLARVIPMDI